ncbi:MAG: cobalt ECF transporter T component CbiQ [Deltaproteobacteria bacterium]|nr:cobalt ECF transporter T component CbiQ [Deltaproteobacteria bacterium]MBF0525536.1 cobalt ECF transporter T component CbiQ [Deltaproteobacteria bacterium]
MKLEEFATGNSFIHHLDPRGKVVAAAFFSGLVSLTQSLTAALAALVLPVILVALARLDFKRLMTRLAVVNGFILFTWFFIPFTFPGRVIYSIGPLDIHWEGVLYACLLTVKSNAIILALIALLGTSPVLDVVHALSHLGVPDKLVHLFFFCFRYLHTIREEYHKLSEALKVRSFRPGTNLHTYRTYAYLVGMLLVRSFHRSQRILEALKCRGFSGRFYILHHYQMKRRDYLFTSCGLVLPCLLVFIL